MQQLAPRGLFGGGQQPVAVVEAAQRIEQLEIRLPCLLHRFGLGEESACCARWPDWCKASAAVARLIIRWDASPLWSAWVMDWRALLTASATRPSVSSNSLRLLAMIAALFQTFC